MAFRESSSNHDSIHSSLSMGNLAQLERTTVEGSRIIRDNLNSVFEELRPLVQPRLESSQSASRITLSNWIHSRSTSMSAPTISSRNDMESFVINLETDERDIGGPGGSGTNRGGLDGSSVDTNNTSQSAPSGPSGTVLPEPEANNNAPADENVADLLALSPEASSFLRVVKKYLPFVVILLAKTIYDYSPAILLFIGLYGTFAFYNSRVRAEIAQHSQRNVTFLISAIVHLLITICVFYYLYDKWKLYLSLVFIPPYVQPLTVSDLLWLVAVTDFILKLITIIIKILLTLIPHSWFETKRRGKWYLAIETTSQLYRSLVPIQPWLYYLLESYQGPQKVVGVFLSAAYMVSKGADLMSRARAWWASVLKLLQNVQLGVSPTKDQLSTAGSTCPICHDDYDKPVLLSCRHVFCESCVARWFDNEQTCPLCRAKVVDDPSWRDGSTTYFAQLF
uniref:RING-type domain-containing protein n=1 Tax=Homalodisca liturata TaxID=320908 RepID=A0A1B6JYG0_9HEMI